MRAEQVVHPGGIVPDRGQDRAPAGRTVGVSGPVARERAQVAQAQVREQVLRQLGDQAAVLGDEVVLLEAQVELDRARIGVVDDGHHVTGRVRLAHPVGAVQAGETAVAGPVVGEPAQVVRGPALGLAYAGKDRGGGTP